MNRCGASLRRGTAPPPSAPVPAGRRARAAVARRCWPRRPWPPGCGGLERLIGLFRWLSPPSGLSLTAAATLATLERSGPRRLTALAAREGVTQPAMTQLVARLQEAGLAERVADPADGRVVQVRITAEGQAMLAGRRAVRAQRIAGLLARLSPDEQAALAAALPAMEALASAQREEPLVAHT